MGNIHCKLIIIMKYGHLSPNSFVKPAYTDWKDQNDIISGLRAVA